MLHSFPLAVWNLPPEVLRGRWQCDISDIFVTLPFVTSTIFVSTKSYHGHKTRNRNDEVGKNHAYHQYDVFLGSSVLCVMCHSNGWNTTH
jgi:hypothetical protein